MYIVVELIINKLFDNYIEFPILKEKGLIIVYLLSSFGELNNYFMKSFGKGE